MNLLLTAIEQDRIPARQIAAPDQERLRTARDAAVRERAIKLFDSTNPDRQQVVNSHRKVLELTGNPNHGSAVFGQNCAVCHQTQGHGPVGPDLGSVRDKPAETLLVAILDPNQAVEARYVNYNAALKDGRELSGVVAEETSNSLTLRWAGGEETILRADLERLTSSGLSLMPEGFEKALSAQDLADVIAFLKKQ